MIVMFERTKLIVRPFIIILHINFFQSYLNPKKRQAVGENCNLSALAGDVGRGSKVMRRAYAKRLELVIDELRTLKHNDHRAAFKSYLRNSPFAKYKQKFVFDWVNPQADDYIVECGSSSGKTCIDFCQKSKCHMLGIDFEQEAVDISNGMMNEYFPELKSRCRFQKGDLTNFTFDTNTTKILMPDFTEHIPDRVFKTILENIKYQLPYVKLFIYTPDRNHIFEQMKARNFILKNPEGHINVKSPNSLKKFLIDNGWNIESYTWRPSHVKYFKYFEAVLGHIPILGKLFRRRIALIAKLQSNYSERIITSRADG